jgi:prepilin peptidase CpaA
MTLTEVPIPVMMKALAVAGAFVAMVTDMRRGMIYNWLTFPLIIIGLVLSAYAGGWKGFGHSLTAAAMGIAFYIGFALVGAIGMGDVKLMGAIGALGGVKFVVSVFLYTSVLGIPHALLIQYLNFGRHAWGMLLTSVMTRAFWEKTIHTDNKESRYHYYLGLDIFFGTLLAVFIEIPLGF